MISQGQRVTDTRRYLDAALDICKITKIENVRELGDFLSSSAMIAAPPNNDEEQNLKDVCWYVPHPIDQAVSGTLRFCSFYEEDFGSGHEKAKSNIEACYSQDLHAIMLRPDHSKESLFMLGCLVIHEAKHALCAVRQRRSGYSLEEKPQSKKKYAQEEMDIRIMEMQLWRERNPVLFQILLDTMVAWLEIEHQKYGDRPGDAVFTGTSDLNINDFALLDQLLGSLPEDTSPANRLSELQVFAHYELIDRSDVPNKKLRKRHIVQQIYAMEGIPGY